MDISHVAPIAIATVSPKTAHAETLAINSIAATTKVLAAMTAPEAAMIAATNEDAVITAIKAGPTATLDAKMVDAMKTELASSVQAIMLIVQTTTIVALAVVQPRRLPTRVRLPVSPMPIAFEAKEVTIILINIRIIGWTFQPLWFQQGKLSSLLQ